MEVSELRTLVVAQMTGALGVKMDDLMVLPSQDAGVWALLTDSLQKWTSFSQHLRDASVAFTVSDGVKVYGLRDTTVFARPMSRIDSVRDDQGMILVNHKGDHGPITRRDLDGMEINWEETTPARPSVWLMEEKSKIRLYAEPDDDYAFTVSGVCLHTAITADDDEVEIEPLDEMAVVRWCAAQWALRSGQGSEAISLAYREGIKQAEACGVRTAQAVNPRSGGVCAKVVRW